MGFISIYYAINLELFHPIWFVVIYILNLSNNCKFKSNNIIFPLKKKGRLGKFLTKNAAFAVFVPLAKN